jgi:hypothetical protein
MSETPDQRARRGIDTDLTDAGWLVQDRGDLDLTAGRGIAVREFRLAEGFGYADYLFFVVPLSISIALRLGCMNRPRRAFMTQPVEVRYKADITAGALKVPESRVIADLLLRGVSKMGGRHRDQECPSGRNPATPLG